MSCSPDKRLFGLFANRCIATLQLRGCTCLLLPALRCCPDHLQTKENTRNTVSTLGQKLT